eukprot:TRINITY_DN13389_c0_g1_i8.p1 TRINITY_DN13389_c0_g1~~TRINITY_DN13389_c0_g1_i8.p1  ORF type:complete len:205 (-),score=46.42 TRINITY_DN13389_c0_g1_i8:160-774(-)
MKFSTLKKENDAARRLHEENADLRLLLKETHDGLESLSVDMKPLKPKMNGLQSDNSALYQIIEDIRKKLHHHLANSKELKENQAKNYRSNLDVIENKRLKDDIRKLQDENAKLKSDIGSIFEEIKAKNAERRKTKEGKPQGYQSHEILHSEPSNPPNPAKYSAGANNVFRLQAPLVSDEGSLAADTPHFLVEANDFSEKADFHC